MNEKQPGMNKNNTGRVKNTWDKWSCWATSDTAAAMDSTNICLSLSWRSAANLPTYQTTYIIVVNTSLSLSYSSSAVQHTMTSINNRWFECHANTPKCNLGLAGAHT